jgi:hypothetical protein
MVQRVSLVVVTFALFVLAGCPSLSTMQTPSTVPKGDVRFGVGFEGIGYKDASGSVTLPQTEFSARYGVTDDIDVGAKLYFLGAELGAKYQFLHGDFEASVAPAVAYISVSSDTSDSSGNSATTKVSVAYIHLPLLLGYKVSDTIELSFGPKALDTIASGSSSASSGSSSDASSATASGFMAGGYFSIPIRLGKAFWVAPEINVYKPFADNTSGVLWQGGLVLLFGGAPHGPAGGAMAPPGAPAAAGPPGM